MSGEEREQRRRALPRPKAASWVFAVLLVLGFGVSWFVPANVQDADRSMQGPTFDHPLGTDVLGRDLAARCLVGLRVSLGVGLVASALAVGLGVGVGAVAGFAGGWLDALLMRTVDVLYGLPYIAIVVVLMVAFGRGVLNLLLALAAVSWLTTARIVRAEVRRLRNAAYVDAARVLGAGRMRLLARHILPHLGGTVLVYGALTVPMAIRQEALLSFLGLGVAPPDASLGLLLREGLGSLSSFGASWWLLVVPGALLVLLTASLHTIADWLRDRFDPRTAGRGLG